MADMNPYLIVLITIVVGIGLSLTLFGFLLTSVSALGSNRKVWGLFCLLFWPLTYVYIFLYWHETQFQRKYLLTGSRLFNKSLRAIIY